MASSGKRHRDSPMEDEIRMTYHKASSSKKCCVEGTQDEHEAKELDTDCEPYEGAGKTPGASSSTLSNATKGAIDELAKKQKRFIQQWYADFVQPEIDLKVSEERLHAMATAIKARPQLVSLYVDQECKEARNEGRILNSTDKDRSLCHPNFDCITITEPYSLVEANRHLPPGILTLVERYVSACHRRRSPNDGRRTVNTGPLRCTFGCGYNTKRAFDWRRHEETHEPQELWLCSICSRCETQAPFLVNRKDKFLKHAADRHGECVAEKVLDESRLEFVSKANQACSFCGNISTSWDERCRHILGHFEHEIESAIRKAKGVQEGQESDEDLDGIIDSASIASQDPD